MSSMFMPLEYRVQVSGCKGQGLWFRVWGQDQVLGFTVQGFREKELGYVLQNLKFRVKARGFSRV